MKSPNLLIFNIDNSLIGIKKIFFPLLTLLFFSCKDESPERAAKDYCNCMAKNMSKSSEVVAMTICEAELTTNFYYYKLSKIILPMEENPSFILSWEENEKSRLFFNKLDSLVYRNCNLNMR